MFEHRAASGMLFECSFSMVSLCPRSISSVFRKTAVRTLDRSPSMFLVYCIFMVFSNLTVRRFFFHQLYTDGLLKSLYLTRAGEERILPAGETDLPRL